MREPQGQPDSRPGTERLVASLCRLLREQQACVGGGDLSRLERLAEQTDVMVAEITRTPLGGPASGGFGCLRKLYGELMLAVRAEMDDVDNQLRRLRRVRKAVSAYRREGTPLR